MRKHPKHKVLVSKGTCPVCHGQMLHNLVGHHFYWPKRLWEKTHRGITNPVIVCHRNCETHYHSFYLTYCKGNCQSQWCRYSGICYRAGRPDMNQS